MSNKTSPIIVTFTVDYAPSEEDNKTLREGLIAFNERATGEPRDREFSVFLKTDRGEVLGGIKAHLDRESICIETLWITESLRGQGYGTKLLNAAHREALASGCIFSRVSTFSFQGEAFYLKNGYERIGEIKNYFFNHSLIFLRKAL